MSEIKKPKVVSGQKLGGPLSKLLGLPKGTTWFELRCSVGEPVTVRCRYVPEVIVDEIVELVSEYHVVMKDDL